MFDALIVRHLVSRLNHSELEGLGRGVWRLRVEEKLLFLLLQFVIQNLLLVVYGRFVVVEGFQVDLLGQKKVGIQYYLRVALFSHSRRL